MIPFNKLPDKPDDFMADAPNDADNSTPQRFLYKNDCAKRAALLLVAKKSLEISYTPSNHNKTIRY